MTTMPQNESIWGEDSGKEMDVGIPAEERVVISGMSGLYPNARHVKDLADILYNKINPVTANNSRWVFKHPETTSYTGQVPGLNYFDAQFFKVNNFQARNMDAMSRKIFEHAYMAIYDAGFSLEQLNGKPVGVYIGMSISETELITLYSLKYYGKSGSSITGVSKTMFANRISYWLNLKGPSISVDQTSCSSTAALELAYQGIQRGDCESAIVGGCSLCLHPQSLIHYGRLHKLSKDGKTKSFDENANGSVKSEAINVLYLQKAKNALRVYAEIVNVKSEFLSLVKDETGGPRFGLYRNLNEMIDFLQKFYEESNVPPRSVEYVEGCGSAIPEVDKTELEAYDEVFCGDRDNPLLIGSVMSNIGNGEAASGISAITKILLGYHTGVLAGNLHCEMPRRDVTGLRDGRMTIVRDNIPFGHGYAAVNGISSTGINAHLLLKGHFKPKDPTRYKSPIPHLVLISGRQYTAVDTIIKDLKTRVIDPEEIALLNNAHGTRISGHLGRGFTVLDNNEENNTISLCEKIDSFDYVKRPVWFVYSGMGSQYSGMGADLMRIPVFANAIERCHRVLQPKGIDIVHIITSPDNSIFNNILYSFLGIAAIQIGLTDILRELQIKPDKIIGHSVGELGCAYADECFTAEEMILFAYNRGLVSTETSFIRGAMAAVGMGYEKIVPMCPSEIDVACHNSPESCTISGPADAVREFTARLVDQNIFAKEVPCSNIAYHSRYISSAGPMLLNYLREVIKTPKLRSERWVSTSVPMDKWSEPSAKYCSAEYYTQNLLNPVLFEEACRLIPSNAILVEIAPHGLFQSILKRSLPESCTNVSLTRRGCNNAIFLLETIGELYIEGLNPKISSLYPNIEYPVSTGTPMLSHLVEWAHHDKWPVPLSLSASKKIASATKSVISLHDEEHKYLQGHVIGEKILYPFAAILVAVWDTLAMTLGVTKRSRAVQFQNVMLHVQPIMHDRRQLTLGITLQRSTGRFEVIDDMSSNVASGFVVDEKNRSTILNDVNDSQSLNVTSKEIYEHFLNRGYAYTDSFQTILSTNVSLTEACIQWSGNWVTFIDGIFQLQNLRHECHPNCIGNLRIYPNEHDKYNDNFRTATVNENYNVTKCGGVIMENVMFNDSRIPAENTTIQILRSIKFMPHFTSNQFDFETILLVYLQIVAENIRTRTINILGVYDKTKTLYKFNNIKRIMEHVPEYTIEHTWLQKDKVINEQKNIFSEFNLVLVFNLATDDYMCQVLHEVVGRNTFIINIRNFDFDICRPRGLYQVVCEHSFKCSPTLQLLRWRPANRAPISSAISVNTPSDLPLMLHEFNCLLPDQTMLVMTTNPAVSGLKDLVNHQFKNKFNRNIVLVKNSNEDMRLDDDALLNIDLAVTVIKDGVFGGEYYVPLRNEIKVKHNVTLQHSLGGLIESCEWVQMSTYQSTGVTVQVNYAALNDLDAKRHNGLIPFNTAQNGYGVDFSGITESGNRVMGLVDCGSVSTIIQGQPDLMWPVPAHWSLEDAATVPFPYFLAYYCLTIKDMLIRPGTRVLVHGGAGSLGQAVISLALANHCEVYATVSNARKKQFLLKMYPDLKADNISNSRDLTFHDLILNATNGTGVDIVISTASGQPKTFTFKCVAIGGIIIDVNQITNREKFEYGMHYMFDPRSYILIDFFSLLKRKGNEMKKLQRMVSDGIARGWVRPISRVTFTPGEVSRAFQLLAGSNHRGRVILCLKQVDIAAVDVQPRLQCSSKQLHIIISDQKYFGIQMVDLLISRGVKTIRLNIPADPEDYKLKMSQWQRAGVQVYCKYADQQDVSGLFTDDLSENVEGIYIIVTDKHRTISEVSASVEAIDAISRKTFPSLKYFAVVNTVNSGGEETCMIRNKDRLAATILKFPELQDIDGNNDKAQISVRDMVASMERAITSEEPVISAHVVSTPPPSLLHQLVAVAGVNIPEDTKDTTTLNDLGMDPANAIKVSVYLRDTHNIFFTVDDIKSLTVGRINYIGAILTRTDFENEKGLNKIFTCVDEDETDSTTEMVFMPTLSSSATLRDTEFDVSLPYLCIVPGMEGHYGRFRSLCRQLKLPALVLQPDIGHPHEKIPEMARRYAEILSQTASPEKQFYLLGYETGVYVVLEMAAILEEKGFTTIVFCIGTPDLIKTEIKEHLEGLETNEALQDAIVRLMFSMMTKRNTDEIELVLQGVTSWDEKLKVTVRTLLGKMSHSSQYAHQLIEAAFGRVLSLLQYEVKVKPLRSQLIILQPKSTAAIQKTALQRYSQQSVVCYQLRAPLSQATDDVRCAAIINAHLDADILEEFEKKNLCETYVLDTEAIVNWCSD